MPGRVSVPSSPLGPGVGIEGGVKIGPSRNGFTNSRALARSSGVKSIKSSSVAPWAPNGGGLVGNGWVGDDRSPGTVD